MSDTFIRTLIEDKHREVETDPDQKLASHALKGALDLTNGHRGDTNKLSDQLAVLTLLVVEQPARHMKACPYLADKARPQSRFASACTVKVGEKSVSLAGPAAVLAVLVFGALGFAWLRGEAKEEARKTVRAAVSAAALNALSGYNDKEESQ